MYALCKAMKWNHLPVEGGLYDQHPKLLDDFMFIMAIESQVEQRRQAKQQRELERQKKQGSTRRRR